MVAIETNLGKLRTSVFNLRQWYKCPSTHIHSNRNVIMKPVAARAKKNQNTNFPFPNIGCEATPVLSEPQTWHSLPSPSILDFVTEAVAPCHTSASTLGNPFAQLKVLRSLHSAHSGLQLSSGPVALVQFSYSLQRG